ncbi:MAG TPA: hypothetical protein VFX98_06080 [Longimicrobiaceae bacterium]|nr:hypothetical protein [Longimicrobiaceae bacterium]
MTPQPEESVVITVEGDRFTIAYPNGRTESGALSSVTDVAIETNDTGPFGSDVIWHLNVDGRLVSYAQGATGEGALLEALQRLPGFDNEAVIEAMGCTDNALFIALRTSRPDSA